MEEETLNVGEQERENHECGELEVSIISLMYDWDVYRNFECCKKAFIFDYFCKL